MWDLILKAFLIYLVSVLSWRFLQSYFSPHPLDNIPGPKRESFFVGNLKQFFAVDSWDWHNYNNATYGRVMKMYGFFGSKQLWVSDPLALHHVIVKDAAMYEEPPWFIESNKLTIGEGILAAVGHRHKKQRKLLNPVFSQKHMRHMIPYFYEVAHKVRDAITKDIESVGNSREVEVLSWVSRAALEIVGVAGLGHSFESFDPRLPPSEYTTAVKSFQPVMGILAVYRRLLHLAPAFGPAWFRRIVVNLIPSEPLHKMRDIADVMHNTAVEAIGQKKRALAEGDDATMRQVGEGNDIMSILLRANMEASKEEALSDAEIIGQMSTLIFAAFDTTSSALARILYMLAQNPDVQDKLRAEIREARKDGDISFDTLVALPYLEAICRETLRVYSPVPQIARITLEDTVLPLSTPIVGVDGQSVSSITLPKSTHVLLGLLATNKDKAIWGEDAHEWKPERWLKPLPESVTDARVPGIYANMMTFSGGGRSCIGFKFSQLEMKIILSILLERFAFELTPDKDIYFNFGGIQFPTVIGGPRRSQMPMKVSLVQ